jgi:hypothetical protein
VHFKTKISSAIITQRTAGGNKNMADLFVDGEDGANGDEAVNVRRAIERVKTNNILALENTAIDSVLFDIRISFPLLKIL